MQCDEMGRDEMMWRCDDDVMMRRQNGATVCRSTIRRGDHVMVRRWDETRTLPCKRPRQLVRDTRPDVGLSQPPTCWSVDGRYLLQLFLLLEVRDTISVRLRVIKHCNSAPRSPNGPSSSSSSLSRSSSSELMSPVPGSLSGLCIAARRHYKPQHSALTVCCHCLERIAAED